MKILYFDIDSLRADHLGCYGYHRQTSPNIDELSKSSSIFENVHASDVPCLPSRTALLTGRFGIHNGVVNHGGTDAEPAREGRSREFWSRLQLDALPIRMKGRGLHGEQMRTVSISSFAQRHSAFHWSAVFDESYNVGKFGLETADEVYALAEDWLKRKGKQGDWFLHVHMWDPHTPYRTPKDWGDKFAEDPIPQWYTEEVRATHWQGCGPHSARENYGYAPDENMLAVFPRQPQETPDMASARKMFDGYDMGVLMADHYIGKTLNLLADLDIDSDTAVIVSSDHGENLGELNVYGDHQTADLPTTRIPMVIKWPGLSENVRFNAKHYHMDVFATILDLLERKIPESWDAKSFASSWRAGQDDGREALVLSQAAWACQRSVRFEDYIYIKTIHDAFHLWEEEMLFDVNEDPHQTKNLAGSSLIPLQKGRDTLANWHAEMMNSPARGRDPHDNVMKEGGPYHVRGKLESYINRLKETERSSLAERLAERHP